MKFLGFVLLVLCAAMLVQGLPKKQVQQQKKCDGACALVYKPVCAADPNDSKAVPKMFGNDCVLKQHNCEHNSNLVEVDIAKCPKTGGVRLS